MSGSEPDPARDVSRERYDLLLEEAQAVERERVRLEGEVTQGAVDRARLEAELHHVQTDLGEAQERLRQGDQAQRDAEGQLTELRAERAVAVARLEAVSELQERVRSLEEANHQLAFALKDAGQGFRQTLLEAGPGQTATPRGRRLVTAAAGLLLLSALILVGVEVAGLNRTVEAAEQQAQEARESDRALLEQTRQQDREERELLAEELRASREDARAWLQSLRDEQQAALRATEEAAQSRQEALASESAARAAQERAAWEERLAEREAEWDAERLRLNDSLERLVGEMEGLRKRTGPFGPPSEPIQAPAESPSGD